MAYAGRFCRAFTKMVETWQTSTRETIRSSYPTNCRHICSSKIYCPPTWHSSNRSTPATWDTRPCHVRTTSLPARTTCHSGCAPFIRGTSTPASRLRGVRSLLNTSGNHRPALQAYTNSGTVTSPLIQFPNTAPPTVGVQYGGGGLDQGVDPNYRDPQANQWNLTVERQVGNNDSLRVSYVGMHSYRLSITEDLNQIPASTTPYQTTAASPYVDPRAPYPNWFTIYSTFNAGEANYNALQVEATHKMSHGLYFDANYTFARNLADNQGDTPTAFAGEVNYGIPIADRFHVDSDYGNVEGTRRQRFLLSGIYQLPFGQGRAFMNTGGWRNAALGGWELTTITLLETGPWLTPSISDSFDQSNTNVLNRGAVLRPDQVSTSLYAGQSRAHYFNLAAFAPTPAGAGRFGNAGVGILQGPGTSAVSLGLAKSFRVTEAVRARFESTFTNVLNHTNFAPPATQIDVPGTFGMLSAPQTAENAGNRTGQVALRIDF